MNRRTVQGRVSGMLGPKYLAYDNVTRRETYTKDELSGMIRLLDQEHQSMLKAYAGGINRYICDALSNPALKMPSEYVKLGVLPEPNWTAEDVLSIMLGFIGQSFMDRFFYGVELSNAALYKYLVSQYGEEAAKGLFNDVVWVDDPSTPTTISSASNSSYSASKASAPNIPDGVERALSEVNDEIKEVKSVMERLGLPTSMGSNMWVVGKEKSATGEAMLHGGPQFWWHFPGFLLEVGLHGAGFEAVGSKPVGFPLVMFGHGNYIAWSSTYGGGDLVDVYVEKLNPNNLTQYLFKGKWVDMERRTDTIVVKGSRPISVTYYYTVHGPVFAIDLKDGVAKNVYEAIEVLSTSSYSVNWFFADRDGNIGFVHTGKDPIRANGIDL